MIIQHRRSIFLIIAFLAAYPFYGLAQVRFYTLLSEHEVMQGQPFQVQYVVEGTKNIRQFELPFFREFEQLDVFESAASSISTQGLQFTETYSKIVVLICKKPGRYTIPGAIALIDGKKMRTSPVKLWVIKSGISSGTISDDNGTNIPIEENSSLEPEENIDEKIKKNLLLKVNVNKTSCYVGEPLEVTYKLYSRLNANSQILKRPSLTGFSVVEMVDSYNSKPDLEKLNGQWYYVNLIRKVQVFPLQAGIALLDAAEVASDIHFVRLAKSRNSGTNDLQSLLNRSASGSAFIHHVTLKSEPLPIVVKPLPEEKQPEEFSGAIGQFTLHLGVVQKQIHPGDLVKVNLQLKGKGNLQLLTPPAIHWPREIDTAEPAVSEDLNKFIFPLSGHKTFTYSFIAPDSGSYHIPAATLIYFDPSVHQYKTATSNEVDIRIEAGERIREEPVGENNAKPSSYLPGIPRQFLWFAPVVLLIIGWISYQFVQIRKSSRPVVNNPTPTAPVLEEFRLPLLHKARLALRRGDAIVFYEEIQSVLWHIVGDVYGLRPSSMNNQNLQQAMQAKGVSPDTISNLSEVLNECSWALYVPGYETTDKEALLVKADELVATLTGDNNSTL